MTKRRQITSQSMQNFTIGLIAILVIITYLGLKSCREQSSSFTRKLEASNNQMETIWIEDFDLWFQGSDWASNHVYAYTTTGNLIAIDSHSGSVLWKRHLPQDELGIRALQSSKHTIFTITATEAHVYEASTGNWVWSTRLGDGHVGIDFQAENALLRVYYGNRIIELSPETGQILKDQSSENIEWITQSTEIHRALPNQGASMLGIDRISGKTLWSNTNPMFIKLEQFPIQSLDNTIFVLTSDLGICSLNIDSGNYVWCRPEEYISNLGLNRDENKGYVIRSDFSLVTIDLMTGKVLEENKFSLTELPASMQNRGFEYSVAITQNTIVVNFGDSDQTFGLKVIK